MDGYDAQKWIDCNKYTKTLGLKLEVSGDKLTLSQESPIPEKEYIIGIFTCVNDVYNFVLGYDLGYHRGFVTR